MRMFRITADAQPDGGAPFVLDGQAVDAVDVHEEELGEWLDAAVDAGLTGVSWAETTEQAGR